MSPGFIRGTDILGFTSLSGWYYFSENNTSVVWIKEGMNHALVILFFQISLLVQIRNDDPPFKKWKMDYVKYVAQAFSDSQAVTLVTLTLGSLSMV